MWQRIWQFELYSAGDNEPITVAAMVPAVAVLILGLLLSAIVARLIERGLRRRKVDATAATMARKIVYYTLLVAIVISTLHLMGIPLTSFAFLGGAIAIGVGFGAQNIINNFISGWILMAERPVRLGDLVEVEGQIGRVESIGARCTRIRRTDGIDLLVPNSSILENTVVNWTRMDRNIRTTVRVGIVYGSPTELAVELIQQAVDERPEILPDPRPDIIFEDFGDNALIFDLYFWCNVNTEMELRRVRSELRFRIDALYREADIIIAFPQRDIHLDTLRPLEVQMVGGGERPPAAGAKGG